MKRLLPKSINNPKVYPERSRGGFTLIELMVVISIIAILAVIGITLFTGVQKGARDAKRKSDIIAISNAMEANYIQGTGYSTTIATSWFAGGAIPTNPGPGGAGYAITGATTSAYTFCALLENNTGNSSTSASFTNAANGQYFCKVQQQ